MRFFKKNKVFYLLIITSLFFSNILGAATNRSWTQINFKDELTLSRTIVLEESKLQINQGETFKVLSIEKLDYVSVLMLKANLSPCADPVLQEEIGVYDFKVEQIEQTIGIEVEENCLFTFYIEAKEQGLKSIFR